MPDKKRLAVIGAGAAGLGATCRLKDEAFVEQLVVFEQNRRIGGTWVYTERTSKDEHGLPVHSSMYCNMLTNFPFEIMGYPNFPTDSYLQDECSSYVSHRKVLRYLEDYATHFELQKYIRFNTTVERVHFDGKIWSVTSRCLVDKKATVTETFDAVIVCNGHYATPKTFSCTPYNATAIHSHDYRHPETYAGKVVACLGAGLSGVHIAIELSEFCQKVYLCHRYLEKGVGCGMNVEQRAAFQSYKTDCIQLEDGSTIQPDVIIYCTGYKMDFPFFDESVKVKAEDEYIDELYQHIVHTEFPNLYFVGIPKTIVPFPLFDAQVKFIVKMLNGSFQVPVEEMREWVQRNYYSKVTVNGTAPKFAHFLGGWGAWIAYCEELAQLAGFETGVPSVLPRLAAFGAVLRLSRPNSYKTIKFKILDRDRFAMRNCKTDEFEVVDPDQTWAGCGFLSRIIEGTV